MEKCHVHLPPATSQTLILSDKVSPFPYIKIKCDCTMNKRNLGKKQRAILRLIKSITKFSNVIGYHQPYLSTLRASDWLKTDAFFR